MTKDNHLDDLPQYGITHGIERKAIIAFENAIAEKDLFVVQKSDRNDYGTDAQIEARTSSSMTNIRVHVQIKGTNTKLNADNSVSVEIDRQNLNYLIQQPYSLYVCYHTPSSSLFVQSAEDTFRLYEKKGNDWHKQKTITINFKEIFTPFFQEQLHRQVIVSGNASRDSRLQWTMASIEQIPKMINNSIPILYLPSDPAEAYKILAEMYNAGQDLIISASFLQFEAVLSNYPDYMSLVYFAEINLAIDSYSFNENRVRKAIPLLEKMKSEKNYKRGSLTYSIANAYLALTEYENAQKFYLKAIEELTLSANLSMVAMCYHNLGSTYRALSDFEKEKTSYKMALDLNSNQPEACFGLAEFLCSDGKYQDALDLFDSITWEVSSPTRSLSVHGWRVVIFFNLRDSSGAFREINTLLNHIDKFEWILPWCAKYVSQFGKSSISTIEKSLKFWKNYLQKFPEDFGGKYEQLLCLWNLHENDVLVEMNFEGFKQEALNLIEVGYDSSFLWDRIGHWAQRENEWKIAEEFYRKACECEPTEYGYCLGVALNYLGRYKEALPILLAQAKKHQPNELSWFGVASAHAGLGNKKDSIQAYKRALKINPDYDLAWFNLGGAYWNSGEIDLAQSTWKEAIAKFPDHELTKEVQQALGSLENYV